MEVIKNFLFPFILIVLLFSTILAAGCIETGRSTQSENYLVGKISVTEVTYLWGNDGLFTKQYVVSYQAVGSTRQSTTMSKAEYESIKNGIVGYFLPDFGYPDSPYPTLPIVIQTTIIPTYTPKIQETMYKGVKQSTANIQMIGNVYGFSTDNISITNVTFVIGLAPGASAIDLTKMKIVFSTPTTIPVILTQGTAENSVAYFTTKIRTTAKTSMNPNDQVEIAFAVAAVPANTRMTIELRPSVGAALPFSKTAPATIANTNVLY